MDIDDILRGLRTGRTPQLPAKLKMRAIVIVIAVVLIVAVVASSLYQVSPESAGVVKRFGQYNRTTRPGLHGKLPFGIESVVTVPVQTIQREEFGFRTVRAGVDSQYLGSEEIDAGRVDRRDLESLLTAGGTQPYRLAAGESVQTAARRFLQAEYVMVTGDLNLIDVEWIVQYKIRDVREYLFNIRSPRETVRDASQAVMRLLVGNGSVDEVLTVGRNAIEDGVEERLQEILDDYKTGILVVDVKLQSSNPPNRVRPSFNEVNQALQQKEQRINEAMQAYNEAVPKTKGEALKLVETAKGYAAERVNQAKGDVSKFVSVLAEYRKAEAVTRTRMYLETMSKVLPRISQKWIIEQEGAAGGILMQLDLLKKD